jgi:hypothetical protein
MKISMAKNTIFGILITFSILIVHYTLKFFSKIQSKQLSLAFESLKTEPPGIINFIYTEAYYFILLYSILFIINLAIFWFGKSLQIVNYSIRTVLIFLTVNCIILLSHSKEETLTNPKVIFYIALLFLILLFLISSRFKLTSTKLIKININKNYNVILYSLIFFSTIQRIIALIIDPNLLPEGDDPRTFYNQALSFLETNSYTPNSGFSPGMSLYLWTIFKFFGEGQFVPKATLILIGLLGITSLCKFTKSYFHSKLLPLTILLFYITSSHYVSFGNQFWNENLFNPIFSIYLFITWKLYITKDKTFFIFGIIVIPALILFLTLLRSWFPLLSSLHIIFLTYFIKPNHNIFFKKFSLLFLLIISYTFLNLYSIQYLNKLGLPTSNSSINLLIGNNPYSQGTYTRHWVTFINDYKIDIDDPKYINKLLDININNPIVPLNNLLKKFTLWTIGAGGPRPISNYYQHPLSIPQYIYRISIFLIMIFGIQNYLRFNKIKILFLLYLFIMIIHLIYFADYRFTLTAMPLQAIFVSIGTVKFLNFLNKTNAHSV